MCKKVAVDAMAVPLSMAKFTFDYVELAFIYRVFSLYGYKKQLKVIKNFYCGYRMVYCGYRTNVCVMFTQSKGGILARKKQRFNVILILYKILSYRILKYKKCCFYKLISFGYGNYRRKFLLCAKIAYRLVFYATFIYYITL